MKARDLANLISGGFTEADIPNLSASINYVAGFRHDTEQSTGTGDGVSTNGHVYAVVDMNGTSDYVEIYGQVNNNGGTPEFDHNNRKNYFGAYRIIT